MDIGKLGKKIGEGFQYSVYKTPENNSVIKIPKGDFMSYDKLMKELELFYKHFEKWLVDTKIFKNKEYGYHIEQPLIANLKNISIENIEDLRSILEEILEENKKAKRDDNIELELIGLEGNIKFLLSKIDNQKQLSLLASKLFQNKILENYFCGNLQKWYNEEHRLELSNVVSGTVNNIRGVFLHDLGILHHKGSLFETVKAKVISKINRRLIEAHFNLNV